MLYEKCNVLHRGEGQQSVVKDHTFTFFGNLPLCIFYYFGIFLDTKLSFTINTKKNSFFQIYQQRRPQIKNYMGVDLCFLYDFSHVSSVSICYDQKKIQEV